jgi:hypothetical protein
MIRNANRYNILFVSIHKNLSLFVWLRHELIFIKIVRLRIKHNPEDLEWTYIVLNYNCVKLLEMSEYNKRFTNT